jgi:hypothetical protein
MAATLQRCGGFKDYACEIHTSRPLTLISNAPVARRATDCRKKLQGGAWRVRNLLPAAVFGFRFGVCCDWPVRAPAQGGLSVDSQKPRQELLLDNRKPEEHEQLNRSTMDEVRNWCARTEECLHQSREILNDIAQRLRRRRPR